jgi:hypothetical protein
VEDIIDASINMKIFGHIVFDEFKPFVTHQVGDILNILLLNQVIHRDNLMTEADKKIAQMRTEKPCTARNQSPLHSAPPQYFVDRSLKINITEKSCKLF